MILPTVAKNDLKAKSTARNIFEEFLSDVVESEIVQAVTEKTQFAKLKIFRFG